MQTGLRPSNPVMGNSIARNSPDMLNSPQPLPPGGGQVPQQPLSPGGGQLPVAGPAQGWQQGAPGVLPPGGGQVPQQPLSPGGGQMPMQPPMQHVPWGFHPGQGGYNPWGGGIHWGEPNRMLGGMGHMPTWPQQMQPQQQMFTSPQQFNVPQGNTQ